MKTVAEKIRGYSFLEGMVERHLQIISEGSEEVSFEAGQFMFHEEEPANRCYLIESGEVALVAHRPGRGETVIRTVGTGDVLGWSSLFAPFVWHLNARVVHPTRAIGLDGGHLLASAERNHDFGYELVKRISHLAIRCLQAARKRLLDIGPRQPIVASVCGDSTRPEMREPLSRLVGAHPFLHGMSGEYLKKLEAVAMPVRLEANQLMVKTGDPANRFYLILHGQVALEAPRLDRTVAIQLINGGDVAGWSWIYEPYVWNFDVRALEPTGAIFFFGTWLLDRCESDHDFGYEIMKRATRVVIQRLQGTHRGLLEALEGP